MDRGAWQAPGVHGVANSGTRLGLSYSMWDQVSQPRMDPSPCIGSRESQPLDHQGSASNLFYIKQCTLLSIAYICM